MRPLLLGAGTLMALVGSGSAVQAVPFDFTYTGSLVTFTVPTTATYQILAFGAQGGNSVIPPGTGGRGAEIGGDFDLTAGEILQIAVGGMGASGGGGGGTFVVGPGNMPLVIAGGGGGAGFNIAFSSLNGGPGLIGPDGGNGGGVGGNGGPGVSNRPGAGGGGGFFSPGGNGVLGAGGGGAFPDLTGGAGSSGSGNGGFGGGGGGGDLGGGGGGGYSGGSGGPIGPAGGSGGGGGGSFDAGTDQILVADFRTGNGEVIITELAAAVPEPTSIALLGAGLASLAALWRRRRLG